MAGRPVRTLEELARELEREGDGEVLIALERDQEKLLSVARVSDAKSARWGGELPKPWLGIETQVVTPELAALMGDVELRGFRVTEVFPWTTAQESGLAVDDVIVALDGDPVEAERAQDAENLVREIENRSIDDEVALEVLRAGERRAIPVRLEARPRSAEEAKTAKQRELEFGVRDITFLDRIERRWERTQAGVLVTEVTPGGWAQMAGLEPSDLILSIGGREVADVAGFERAIAAALGERAAVVPFFVRRGWRTHFVFLEPEWSELELPAGGLR